MTSMPERAGLNHLLMGAALMAAASSPTVLRPLCGRHTQNTTCLVREFFGGRVSAAVDNPGSVMIRQQSQLLIVTWIMSWLCCKALQM